MTQLQSVSRKRQATGNEGDDNSFTTDIGWNKQVIDDVYCSAPESTNSEETPVIEVAGASNLYQEKNCQTPRMYPELEKRRYFIEQVTSLKACYRYIGITRPKLDLVFGLVEEKANSLCYWRGSIDTTKPGCSKRKGKERALTTWEEFVFTLVRTRKGFDVNFLADTFGITSGQVSRIYNTWIIFLSSELSFLVPWPS